MPYKYVLESVCDRIAACITYEKENYTKESALKYFTSRSDSFLMHEKTSKLMLEILTRISIAELQEKAKLTLVSATSIVEGGAHDVIVKNKESEYNNH